MGVSKKPSKAGNIRPLDQIGTQAVRIRVLRPDGVPVIIEGEVNPIHGDWLWDLLDVPETQRTNLLEVEVPAAALRLVRR